MAEEIFANPGNPRKYRGKGIRHCVEYYNPCDINRKGKHVGVRRCKRYAPGPG